MPKYRLTRDARDDIGEILAYIAEDNIDAAISFDDRLTESFELLARWKESGRERPELGESLRSFPHRRYMIFYKVWAEEVVIVRVIHGARDIEEIFR